MNMLLVTHQLKGRLQETVVIKHKLANEKYCKYTEKNYVYFQLKTFLRNQRNISL